MPEQQRPQAAKPNTQGVRDEAAKTAGAARQVGAEAQQKAQQLGDKAQQLGDQAQEKARGAVASTRQRAESLKDQAADRIEGASEAVHKAAHDIEGEQAWMAELIERGAEELDRLAGTLRDNDLRRLLHDAQDLAQRQPVLFAGGAFALGFAAMRAARAGLAVGSRAASGAQRSGQRGGNGVDDGAYNASDAARRGGQGAQVSS